MVSDIVDSLSQAYPEMLKRKSYIQEVIKHTQLKQAQKHQHWSEVVDRYVKKINQKEKMTGEQLWKLFKGDNKGEEISIEFIQTKLNQLNRDFDMNGFNRIYLAHNDKALRNQKNTRKDNSVYIEMAKKIHHLPRTDDSFKYEFEHDTKNGQSVFKGPTLKAKIISMAVKDPLTGSFRLVDELKVSDECLIVLDRTNFYPESGGQAADRGVLRCTNGRPLIQVSTCHNIQGFTFHEGKVVASEKQENIG
jgi:alanyl-tRNA synthetase